MKDIVIIGTGGHGREAVDIIDAMNSVKNQYRIIGLIDDGKKKGSTARPHSHKILGTIEDLKHMDVGIIPAIGHPKTRQTIVQKLPHHVPVDAVHPTATIGSHVTTGPGLMLAAGARITHSVQVGSHVHLNVNSTVSHDCSLGNFVTITPGVNISGGVKLGDRVWVGVGAAIIQSVHVGDDVTIGAGAAVIRDAPDNTTQVGVPAHEVT